MTSKKALLIVDIQEYYKEFYTESFLEIVEEFICKNKYEHIYDKIYMLVDINKNNKKGEFVPSFLEQSSVIFKTYAEAYSRHKLTKHLNENIQLSMIPKHKKLSEGALVYGIDNGSAYIDYIDDDLYNLFVELEEYDSVDIIGGLKDFCVKKTSIILRSFNSNINIIDNLCFGDKETNLTNLLEDYYNTEWLYLSNTNNNLIQYYK